MNYEKTVVHCPTEELAKKVLVKAHNMGYKWHSGRPFLDYTNWERFKGKTCYNIEKGMLCDLDWYKSEGFKIISAEEFLNPCKKVYYRGDYDRGSEIINALKYLGANANPSCGGVIDNYLYFINTENNIDYVEKDKDWLLQKAGYVETHLPEEKETITVCGKTFIKEEFEKAINNLKEVKQ